MVDKPRLPYDDMPQDLKCPVCDFTGKNMLGFRNHCSRVHDLRWELKQVVPSEYASRYKLKEIRDLNEISDLKPWHQICIMQKMLFNTQYNVIARMVHKSDKVCRDVIASPAGQKYAEKIRDMMKDMPALLQMAFNSSLLGLATQDAAALQMAIDVQDYEFIHKFVTDHYKITGVIDESKKDVQAQQQAIHLHLDTSTLDIPTVKTEHKVLEVDAEIVDD
jgi:hypothetical protein